MRYLCAFLSTIIFLSSLHAQNTVGQKLLMAPKTYNSPTGFIEASDCERQSATNSNNIWIVFSDRANNPTYATSKGGAAFKKMGFMDAFYVIKDEGEYLHLVKFEIDPSNYDKNYKLTKNLEDWGWAPKSNMLLWTNSLVEDKTKFTIKALSINSVQNLNNIATFAKGKDLRIFNDPDLKDKNENGVRLFDFLYIYKRTEKSVLIAIDNRISRVAAKFAGRKVYGWVDRSVVIEWKDRTTLEPNWDAEAVDERKKNGIKTAIFSSPAVAENYKNTGAVDPKTVLWENDKLSTARKIPEWKRLPYLGVGNAEGTFKTGAVTDVFNNDNQVMIEEDEQALVRKAYGDLRKSYRKVNIVFVVDGSETMKDYYQGVLGTLIKTANYLDSKNQEEADASANSYKMGLVIYRDYGDHACGTGGIDDFNEKTLTTNYTDIVDYFNNEVKFGSCSKEKSTRRAMYAGIMKAMRQFQEAKNQTNVIVLIGAGANRPDDSKVSQKELINLLSDYRVGLLAFQAKQPVDPAYTQFAPQVFNLLKQSAQTFQAKLSKDFPDRKFQPASLYDRGNNLHKLDCPNRSPVPGGIMLCDQLNPINPEQLQAEVANMLNELLQSIEVILEGVNSKINAQGVRTDMNEGMTAFLSQMNVDVDLLRKSSYENIQLFVEGYTSKTCNKIKNPLFKYCIFLSESELFELIKDLQSVDITAESRSEQRTRIYEAFKSLLATRLGPKEAKSKMSKFTPAEVLALMTGLETQSDLFKTFKLSDITKEKVVSQEQIDNIVITIGNAVEELKKYKAATSNSFNSNDQDYYWLPADLLP